MLPLLRRLTRSKLLALSVAAVLVVGVVAAAFFLPPQGQTPVVQAQQRGPGGPTGGLVVRTVPVGVGPISTVLGYAGAVQPTQQVNVVARASGVIQELPVDVGSVVHRGDRRTCAARRRPLTRPTPS